MLRGALEGVGVYERVKSELLVTPCRRWRVGVVMWCVIVLYCGVVSSVSPATPENRIVCCRTR